MRVSARVLALCVFVSAVAPLAVAQAFVIRNPESRCLRGRLEAAAKYAECEQAALAEQSRVLGFDPTKRWERCRAKYFATWSKLERKAQGTGTSCDRPRFTIGAETVIDNLTGLEWERKTDDGSIHDVGRTFTWSTTEDGNEQDADGTVFTEFLSTLNADCFASHCDWRLPTRAELPTILADPSGCSVPICIDPVTFGPVAQAPYWGGTPYASDQRDVWCLGTLVEARDTVSPRPARAVRGGL